MANKGQSFKTTSQKTTTVSSSKTSRSGVRVQEIEDNLNLRDDDQLSIASHASSTRSSSRTPAKKTQSRLEEVVLQPFDEHQEDELTTNIANPSLTSDSGNSVYTRYQCKLSNGKQCPIKDCLIHHRKKGKKRIKTSSAGNEVNDVNEFSDEDSDEESDSQEEEEVEPQLPPTSSSSQSTRFRNSTTSGLQNLARLLGSNSSTTSRKDFRVSARASSVSCKKSTSTVTKTATKTAKAFAGSSTRANTLTNGNSARQSRRGKLSSSLDLFSSDEDDEEYNIQGRENVIRYVTEFITLRRFKRHPYVEKINAIIEDVTPEPIKKVSRSVHSWMTLHVPNSVQNTLLIILFWLLLWSVGLMPSIFTVVDFLVSSVSRIWSITHCLLSSMTLPSFMTAIPSVSLPVMSFWPFSSSSSPVLQDHLPVSQCNTCPDTQPDTQLQARIQQLELRLQELLSREPVVVPQTEVHQPLDDLESLVRAAVEKSSHQTREEILNWVRSRPELMTKSTPSTAGSGVTLEDVKRMILLYDADKTGITDYAFEPSGGTIVSKHCSDTFDKDNQAFKLFGIHVFSSSNSPRKVIQAGTTPGDCWAFSGSNGYVTIRLARKVIPTSFTLEHAQKRLLPGNSIDSAVKSFSVRGLINPDDVKGEVLGDYEYRDDEDHPLQTFQVQESNPRSFEYIRLVINSNHGNPDYTCVYRFRVHGKLPTYG